MLIFFFLSLKGLNANLGFCPPGWVYYQNNCIILSKVKPYTECIGKLSAKVINELNISYDPVIAPGLCQNYEITGPVISCKNGYRLAHIDNLSDKSSRSELIKKFVHANSKEIVSDKLVCVGVNRSVVKKNESKALTCKNNGILEMFVELNNSERAGVCINEDILPIQLTCPDNTVAKYHLNSVISTKMENTMYCENKQIYYGRIHCPNGYLLHSEFNKPDLTGREADINYKKNILTENMKYCTRYIAINEQLCTSKSCNLSKLSSIQGHVRDFFNKYGDEDIDKQLFLAFPNAHDSLWAPNMKYFPY